MRMIGIAESIAVVDDQIVASHDGINEGKILSRMRDVGKVLSYT